MTIPDAKSQVQQWIDNGAEYNQGIILYNLYGKNKFLKKDFPGKQHRYATKIIYELCKSVGIAYATVQNKIQKSKIIEPNDRNVRLVPSSSEKKTIPENQNPELPENLVSAPSREYPQTIRRIIAEYAETFQERSKLHKIITEMPEGNSQTLQTKRAEILGIIKNLSDRLKFLFHTRQDFEKTGHIPENAEIWPEIKLVAKPSLPDEAQTLKKIKKNYQSANSKDQNLLDYQNEKKVEVKKPMPPGPKRSKIQNRIKARLKFIQEIDHKLSTLIPQPVTRNP